MWSIITIRYLGWVGNFIPMIASNGRRKVFGPLPIFSIQYPPKKKVEKKALESSGCSSMKITTSEEKWT